MTIGLPLQTFAFLNRVAKVQSLSQIPRNQFTFFSKSSQLLECESEKFDFFAFFHQKPLFLMFLGRFLQP